MDMVSKMKWIEASSYEQMSKMAAFIFIEQLAQQAHSTFALPTGATPLGFYKELVAAYKAGDVTFEDVQSFNLDEYVGVSPNNAASYHYYMKEHLFRHVNIKEKNIHVPIGDVKDLKRAEESYEQEIEKAGGIDLVLLGIGTNGHIGFNEPGSSFTSRTTVIQLAHSTRQANKKYFERLEDVPTHAITMGIATIMKAKKIVLLIAGESKQQAYEQLRSGIVTEAFPASVLHTHDDVVVIYTGVQ